MTYTNDTLPKRFKRIARERPYEVLTYSKDAKGEYFVTMYGEFYKEVQTLGEGLLEYGITRGNHVGIISDNRKEWLVTDLALLGIGAIDVPRGCDSTAEEISYILQHAECPLAFFENIRQIEKIVPAIDKMPNLHTIVLYEYSKNDPDAKNSQAPIEKIKKKLPKHITLHTYDEIYEAGIKKVESTDSKEKNQFEKEIEKGNTDDMATIIYTSGTTGEPKGVMLTHRSFLFQMDRIEGVLFLGPGDIFLSVLPIWHSFERAVEYIVINKRAAIAYSKPVGKVMLNDMAQIRPTWMTSVPRIWEGIRSAILRKINQSSSFKKFMFYTFVSVGELWSYMSSLFLGRLPDFRKRNRIVDKLISIIPLIVLAPFRGLGELLVFKTLKKKLGGRFVAGVSGGGAMPGYVDRFFQAVGIKVLEGYGLTETGPILSVRLQKSPILGTVGPLLRDIEHKVIDEHGSEVAPGHKGVLWVKSNQIMKGYYKKPKETEKIMKKGWLNTGDIAVFTHNGEFTILGREKETIVLLGGENIEPTPIEEKIVQSEYIEQVMVVGQDKKFLGALIVPNTDKIDEYAKNSNIQYVETEELADNAQIQELLHEEIQRYVNPKTGFKPFERVFRFEILTKPFEAGDELTPTMKIRRNIVNRKYETLIEKMFH